MGLRAFPLGHSIQLAAASLAGPLGPSAFYRARSGMGSVGANAFSSSFTTSVHRPQSVLPPLPSMTSGAGKGSWGSHFSSQCSLKVSRVVCLVVSAREGSGAGVGADAVVRGVVAGWSDAGLLRLNRLLNMVLIFSQRQAADERRFFRNLSVGGQSRRLGSA